MPDISQWREPKTRAVALTANPPEHATDNGVLFTCVAFKLGLIDVRDFRAVVDQYRCPKGFLWRYPGTGQYMSYDDYIGASSADLGDASWFEHAFHETDYVSPDGNWLGRFPILEPVVRMGAVLPLGPENEAKAVAAYAANVFEAQSETSGKQLLWLATDVLSQNRAVALAIDLWRIRMNLEYPNGLSDMMAIYYKDPDHPFHQASKGKQF